MRNPFTQKLLLIVALLCTVVLTSCRDKIEVAQIERVATFSFSYDNLTKQFAENAYFFQGKTVLHEYEDGSSELFTRYLLTASGINDAGNTYSINIEFDLVNDGTYIGIYRPQYEKGIGGIYSFNYLENVSGNYKSYDLDPASIGEIYFRVERQNMEEKLVLGDFYAKLQNDKKPEEKIIFYEGTFKDISYVLE
jgi:hypothetical protein